MAKKKRKPSGGGRPRPQGSSSSRPRPSAPKPPAAAAGTASPAGRPAPAAPPTRTKPTKAERIAAVQAAQRRRAQRRRVLIAATVAAVVVGIVAYIVADRRATTRLISQLEAGGCEYDTRHDGDSGQGRNHVSSPVYRVDPPSGGDHLAAPSRAGSYPEGNVPPDGGVVHALEHGDVAIWYQPGIDRSVLEGLERILDRYRDDVLLVARPSLSVPVAATAWHDRLLCPTPDLDALDRFVRTWRDKGPEKVPE